MICPRCGSDLPAHYVTRRTWRMAARQPATDLGLACDECHDAWVVAHVDEEIIRLTANPSIPREDVPVRRFTRRPRQQRRITTDASWVVLDIPAAIDVLPMLRLDLWHIEILALYLFDGWWPKEMGFSPQRLEYYMNKLRGRCRRVGWPEPHRVSRRTRVYRAVGGQDSDTKLDNLRRRQEERAGLGRSRTLVRFDYDGGMDEFGDTGTSPTGRAIVRNLLDENKHYNSSRHNELRCSAHEDRKVLLVNHASDEGTGREAIAA